MYLKNLKFIVYLIPGVLVVLLAVFSILMYQNQQDLNQAQEVRYKSYLIADELRQSSDSLTRLARTFVATGNSKYEKAYNHILEWRSGKIPRPEDAAIRPGETIAQTEIMKDLGFTDKELAKLEESTAKSNELVATETKAMNAMKGLGPKGETKYSGDEPAKQMALRIMFDDQYHAYKKKIMKPINEFFDLLKERTKNTVTELAQKGNFYLKGILVSLVLLVISGAFALILSRRTLANSVNSIATKLSQISQQLVAGSGQLASASKNLSEGSSEQASSLEETSSSIEQMTSQTKQTADNAQQANSAVKETAKVVSSGVEDMNRVSSTMHEIKDSAEETSKIVKTIDDIAFQTNLLALNAAVEAARAGEAGKGFAVVAEEVRNLAQRSSDAAKETSQLIEKSQNSAQTGVSVVDEASQNLQSIKEYADKVDTLVDEITSAASEQSQGIDQINQTVSEMDKTVQQNASNSEEASSAADEINSQAKELDNMMEELVGLVGRKSTGRKKASSSQSQGKSHTRREQGQGQRQQVVPAQQTEQQAAKRSGGNQQSQKTSEQAIPLDDDEFKDF